MQMQGILSQTFLSRQANIVVAVDTFAHYRHCFQVASQQQLSDIPWRFLAYSAPNIAVWHVPQ